MAWMIAKCTQCHMAGRVEAKPERGTFLFDVMFMWNMCWACGGKWTFSKIRAAVSPTIVCDHRCTSSKGHSCTCSCGGQNHGRDAHLRHR